MTIINGIEIDDIKNQKNEIKYAILNNDKIENKLHVVIVISNPCQFARRYILAREFIKRIEMDDDVLLYVVELAYNDQKYYITQKNNKRHLQLHANIPLWHKENMINVAVKKLLPKNWKAFAWIDADVEFESSTWASDALKILNGHSDVLQLFSHCIDMAKNETTMTVHNSFSYQYCKGLPYGKGVNFWHPGYAWACTRKAYEKMGGLYDLGILGSGDNIMSLSFINNGIKSINSNSTNEYKQSILDFQNNVNKFRIGYVPGVILHYYHGSKKNRKYTERWQILINHSYDPYSYVKYNDDGLLIPTDKCPKQLLDDILNYFLERNEDENN